jgi:hypothetical protein
MQWELLLLPTAARITVKASTASLSGVAAPAIQTLLQEALSTASVATMPNLAFGGAAGHAPTSMPPSVPAQAPTLSSVFDLGNAPGGVAAAATVPAKGPQADLLEGLF